VNSFDSLAESNPDYYLLSPLLEPRHPLNSVPL
jgi:hypothetical protein